MKIDLPLKLYYDSKVVISIANNRVHHNRIKYIEIDHHYIKDKVDGITICLPFVTYSQEFGKTRIRTFDKNSMGCLRICYYFLF